jgi:hypothetical protein
MTTYATTLNEDQNGIKTSSEYLNRGDGTISWYDWARIADGGNAALGAKADAAVSGGATTGSLIALIKGLQLAFGVTTDAGVAVGNAAIIPILKSIRDQMRTGIPTDATPVHASSGAVSATTATASIAAVSAKTNYVTGIEITGGGATGASVIVATLSGLLGGSHVFAIAVPAGVTLGITPLIVEFTTPIPASTTNTAITIQTPTFGAGNTHAVVNIHGYRI